MRWVGTFQEIARHVVRVHASAGNVGSDDPRAKQDENWLKRSPTPSVATAWAHVQPVCGNRLALTPGSDTCLLSRYIEFCRSRCAPRLSARAADVLQNNYVRIRQVGVRGSFHPPSSQPVLTAR